MTHDEHIRFCYKASCKVAHYSFAENLSHGTHHAANLAIHALLFLQYVTMRVVYRESPEIDEVEWNCILRATIFLIFSTLVYSQAHILAPSGKQLHKTSAQFPSAEYVQTKD